MALLLVQDAGGAGLELIGGAGPGDLAAHFDEEDIIEIADEFQPGRRGRPWSARIRHWLDIHFLLIGILLALLVAGVYPALGAAGGPLVPSVTSALIAVPGIFFVSGISVHLHEFKKSIRFWRFNLYVQGFTWVVIPLVVFIVVQLLALSSFFSMVFLDGLLVMACVPMTINNSFVLARAVHGNEAAAILNSVVGNFVGVVLSPLLIVLLVAPVGGFDFAGVTAELAYKVGAVGKPRCRVAMLSPTSLHSHLCFLLAAGWQVLLPLAVGQSIRRLPIPSCKKWIDRHEKLFARTSEVLLIYLIYTTFCDTFLESASIAPAQIGALVPLVLALYLAFAIVSWHLAGSACLQLSAGDRVTALFASTQKTVAMGIPIISATFGNQVGTYAIPLMIYQIVQIVVPSMVIGRLRRYIKKQR